MMIKKLFKGLTIAALCLSMQFAQAANIKDFPRVAVMNFGNKAITSSGLREHDLSSASEYAIFQLSNCGWFDLVDYEQLSTIAKIHSVNMSGLVDPATAVSVGKFAGAEFMVIGNVTGLTTKENVFGYQHGSKGGVANAQHVVTANVAVRIVDIETGRIVAAGLGKGSSTSTHTELSFKKYRNRKVETEDISDTITTDIIDEHTKNRKTSNTSSASKKTDKKANQSQTITDTGSSTENFGETTSHGTEKNQETTNSDKKTTNMDNSSSLANNTNRKTTSEVIDEGSTTPDYKLTPWSEESSAGSTKTETSNNNTMYEQEKKNTSNTIERDDASKTYNNSNEHTISSTELDSQETNESSEYNVNSSDDTDETSRTANNQNRVQSSNKSIYYERETEDYVVTIGTVEVSDIQVRNAISKAVRDAIYGNTGIMTVLNGGKQLKIKTGF